MNYTELERAIGLRDRKEKKRLRSALDNYYRAMRTYPEISSVRFVWNGHRIRVRPNGTYYDFSVLPPEEKGDGTTDKSAESCD